MSSIRHWIEKISSKSYIIRQEMNRRNFINNSLIGATALSGVAGLKNCIMQNLFCEKQSP